MLHHIGLGFFAPMIEYLDCRRLHWSFIEFGLKGSFVKNPVLYLHLASFMYC